MTGDDDGMWFRPKAFGIGLVPIAWQGWALIGVYILILAGIHRALHPDHRATEVAMVLIVSAGLFAIAAHHTRGGLRWRWGSAD